MRFAASTAAAAYIFFSLSSAVLGQSELDARNGRDDGPLRDDRCIPFKIEKSCVRGRCDELRKCELGFEVDPLRLCCVREYGRRGDDGDGGDGKGDGVGKDQDGGHAEGGHHDGVYDGGGYGGGKDHDGGHDNGGPNGAEYGGSEEISRIRPGILASDK